MNDSESELFTQELIIAFPAFWEVAERSSTNSKATKKGWSKAWFDLSLGECREALRQLILEGGISYEGYREPGPLIRRMVLSSRSRGRTSEAERAESSMSRQSRTDYTGSPMAQALAMALKADSMQGAFKAIEAVIPTRAEYEQPRYDCHWCVDRGLVLVWRADFVRMVRDGKMSVSQLHSGHTYNVACSCSRGGDMNRPKNPRFKMPFFSSAAFCVFKGADIEADRQRLLVWLDENTAKVKGWVA